VLDVPLNLPDGSEVVVVDHVPDDAEVVGPDSEDPQARSAALQFYLEMLKRRNLPEGTDGQAKIEADRVAEAEKLILEIAGMWAARPETADPDKWVRRQWGRDE